MPSDERVLVGITTDEPEEVLLADHTGVELRGLGDDAWSENTAVGGLPAVYGYTSGGALVDNF